MGKRRKTKNQKIISSLRRQLAKNDAAPLPTENYAYNLTQLKGQVVPGQSVKKEKISTNIDIKTTPTQIKNDLLKTFVLSAMIVIFELVIYFKLN